MSTQRQEIFAAIEESWGSDTAADRQRWSSARPSTGQCAVTALVIQDLLGGELLRAVVAGDSHYWNRLTDGTELDLTRNQFDKFLPGPVQVRSRDYVLSYPATARRYRRLAGRVAYRLDQAAA